MSFAASGARAQGDFSIMNGSISGSPLQEVIPAFFGQEWLRRLKFDRCRGSFRLSQGVLHLIAFDLASPLCKVLLYGTFDLNREGLMNLEVKLLFHRDVVNDLKPKELRFSLEPIDLDPDYLGLEFRVWGPPEKPETDFARVLARKAVGGWLRSKIRP